MFKEIEILYELDESLTGAVKKCGSANATKVYDIYYKVKPRTCLRLRKIDSVAVLTCKKDIYNGDVWIYSDEFETSVNFEETKEILSQLFDIYVELDITKYISNIKNYKVIVEKVNGLGNFLEVERQGEVKDIEQAKQEIRVFVGELDIKVKKELNKGKPELMWKKTKKLW